MLLNNPLKFPYPPNGTNRLVYIYIYIYIFEDNTIEFLFHRIENYIKEIGAGDMFPAQQIFIPRQQSCPWGLTGIIKGKK